MSTGAATVRQKKRLETATKKYRSLPRTARKELEDDRKGSIISVYDYVPLVAVDAEDSLQRFGYVKVEGMSFTVSEPFSPLEIEPLLYTYANAEQRKIIREQFGVEPFSINTIRLERIGFDGNEALPAAYLAMQENYIFKEQDVLPLEFVEEQWVKLGERLKELD